MREPHPGHVSGAPGAWVQSACLPEGRRVTVGRRRRRSAELRWLSVARPLPRPGVAGGGAPGRHAPLARLQMKRLGRAAAPRRALPRIAAAYLLICSLGQGRRCGGVIGNYQRAALCSFSDKTDRLKSLASAVPGGGPGADSARQLSRTRGGSHRAPPGAAGRVLEVGLGLLSRLALPRFLRVFLWR